MASDSTELEMEGGTSVSPSDGGVRKHISLKLNQKIKSTPNRMLKRPIDEAYVNEISSRAFVDEISTRLDRDGPEPLHLGQKLNWDYRGRCNLIGEKIQDPIIHLCDSCDLPILQYGRMIPCKHVFCFDCSTQSAKKCTRCEDPVTRIEKAALGSVYLCTFGGSKHGRGGCRRTYLSKRDLDAHVSHRHKVRSKPATQMKQEVGRIPLEVARAPQQRPPLINTPPQQPPLQQPPPGFPEAALPNLSALVSSGPPPVVSSAMYAVVPGPAPLASHSSSNLITLTDSAARPNLPQMSAAMPFQNVAPPLGNSAFSVPPPGVVPFQPQFHPLATPAVFQQPPPSNPQFSTHAPVPLQGPPHQGPPHQGPPHQGPPHQGPPHQGPPHQGPPHQGPPHQVPINRPPFY